MATSQMAPIPTVLPAAARTVTAAEFKAKCLALMDEVCQSDAEIIVTKRGKPVARLTSVPPLVPIPFLNRSQGIMEETGDIVSPVNPDWDVDADL
ncbi:MAG: type II toxin-antitoxin system Phd/YefM family antitoxin [Bryobacteraceae bacterium]